MPTAANDSVAFTAILPTMAASVSDNTGSEMPEIKAGIASLFMFFKLIADFTELIHNNKMDNYFVLET